MNIIDWIVMLGTLFGIIGYGIWKTRHIKSVESYLKGDRDLPWWTIGLSIMATQASAITFLSTPGQAYQDGMGFAQFYFGLPLAMVFLSVFVLPIYYRLNVYTAYEYLERRFDVRTRTLTSFLFLIQRGLAAGLTIYAPAIILSKIMGWDLNLTIFFIGALVTLYTVSGGTKAVSVTQKQQMIVILTGMFIAAIILVFKLPPDVGLDDALGLAGKMGKLEVVSFEFDLSNRYNIWSGILGGVFLFLSYFGTDQSQVQRYLSGKSLTQSRLGLMFNGLVKVPMQFLILFVGILVYVFFQFNTRPVHFNTSNVAKLAGTNYEVRYKELEKQYYFLQEQQQGVARQIIDARRQGNTTTVNSLVAQANELEEEDQAIREKVNNLILTQDPDANTKDTDYVFITFIIRYLPIGLVGLLLAVIFSAAMSSTASELSALATTSVIDIYKRLIVQDASNEHYLAASKWMTVLWGVIALIFAASASLFDNLIQAVNIVGSLFYGTILGVFLVAFFMKQIGSKAVFWAAILTELLVIGIYFLDYTGLQIPWGDGYIQVNIAYLWLNLIGCVLVMGISLLANVIFAKK